jgi:hypothetical protein
LYWIRCTHKSNENTSDLTNTLIKQFYSSCEIIVSILKKMLFVILRVVCEGRFFERPGDAMEGAQKVVLEQTTSAVGEGLFYIMLL